MITALCLLLVSLLALYLGTGWLVRGSSSLAAQWKVCPLVTGFTIVAFGTSTPELFVSFTAAIHQQGDIAMGNIIGSNIFNSCIVLGVSALICPIKLSKHQRIDLYAMILSTAGFAYFLWEGRLTRMAGVTLFSGLIIYVFLRLKLFCNTAGGNPPAKPLQQKKIPRPLLIANFLFIAAGAILLFFSTRLLINNSLILAKGLHINEANISILLIAFATSIPELFTALIAAKQKNPQIAVGIVAGSNIFNILGIAGICAASYPIYTAEITLTDLLVMCGTAFLLLPLVFTKMKISRWEGGFLLIIYCVYAIALLIGII